MKVVERVLHGKILPVARRRRRLVEVAVFHQYDICIEYLCQFLDIVLAQSVVGIIAFGNEYRWAVETTMAQYHSLLEVTFGSFLGVKLLLDEEHVLLLKKLSATAI